MKNETLHIVKTDIKTLLNHPHIKRAILQISEEVKNSMAFLSSMSNKSIAFNEEELNQFDDFIDIFALSNNLKLINLIIEINEIIKIKKENISSSIKKEKYSDIETLLNHPHIKRAILQISEEVKNSMAFLSDFNDSNIDELYNFIDTLASSNDPNDIILIIKISKEIKIKTKLLLLNINNLNTHLNSIDFLNKAINISFENEFESDFNISKKDIIALFQSNKIIIFNNIKINFISKEYKSNSENMLTNVCIIRYEINGKSFEAEVPLNENTNNQQICLEALEQNINKIKYHLNNLNKN